MLAPMYQDSANESSVPAAQVAVSVAVKIFSYFPQRHGIGMVRNTEVARVCQPRRIYQPSRCRALDPVLHEKKYQGRATPFRRVDSTSHILQ